MQVPRDQGLFFTVFFSVCLTFILVVWVLLPAHREHGEEGERKKVLNREEAVLQAEIVLGKAEELVSELEKKVEADQKKKGKKKAK